MFLRFAAMGIALLAIFSGLAALLIGGLVALTGTAVGVLAPPSADSLQALGAVALISLGLVVMIAGLLQIIFGIGVWKLSGWAWILGFILQSLTFVSAFLGLFTGAVTAPSLVTLLISGAMLAWLLTPRVRKAFGRGKKTIPLSAPTTKPINTLR